MSDVNVTLQAASRKHTERLALAVLGILGFLAATVLLDNVIGLRAYDSSDNGTQRSGMRVHSDAQTGCEYLSAVGGGITPRLGADGRQTGCHR